MPTRIYGPTGHAIGGTAQQALLSCCYHRRASPPSVTTTGRAEQPDSEVDLAAAAAGARGTRMSAGRMEQQADSDVGQSKTAASGLNDHATTGSGPTRQSDARDSDLLVFSRQGTGRVTTIAG